MVNQAWITQVLEEENILGALVLGRSLKRSKTQQSTIVIVPQAISTPHRLELEKAFDFVVTLDQKYTDLHGESNMIGLTFASSMTLLDKAVYLPPNTMVLRNFDVVFDEPTDDFDKELAKYDKGGILVKLKPSKTLTEELEGLMKPGQETWENLIGKLMEGNIRQNLTFLSRKHFVLVNFQNSDIITNADDIFVCVLDGLPSDNKNLANFDTMDPLRKYLYNTWLEFTCPCEQELSRLNYLM